MLVLLILLSALLASPEKVDARTISALQVRIVGLTSADGGVACALFGSAKEFPDGVALRKSRLAIEDGAALWTVGDLPPGSYAVSCYHDIDGNGRLDRNPLGVPVEPYGFSNGARGTFGPPRFRKARFRLDDSSLALDIPLK